jgi:hypothetical protein
VQQFIRNRKGYGYACLKGMEYIASQEIKPDIIVFSRWRLFRYPEELTKLLNQYKATTSIL